MKIHRYTQTVEWTGNTGQGTQDYRSYERSFVIEAAGKPKVSGSSDAAFRGDASQYNPEDMLVSALASCHMLWYLHLCADAGVVVSGYRDEPEGVMELDAEGSGRFVLVHLRPEVVIGDPTKNQKALALHEEAHRFCFISNSVNFEVRLTPSVSVDHSK